VGEEDEEVFWSINVWTTLYTNGYSRDYDNGVDGARMECRDDVDVVVVVVV
jgi:hypothetical protein